MLPCSTASGTASVTGILYCRRLPRFTWVIFTCNQGRLQEAMSYYQQATQRFDEYMPWYPIIAHCRLGEGYCELNNVSSAEEHLRKLCKMADDIAVH